MKITMGQRNIAYAASTDCNRGVLQCVCIRGGMMSASNGYMMAQCRVESNANENWLIPADDILSMEFISTLEIKAYGSRRLKLISDIYRMKPLIVVPPSGNYPNLDEIRNIIIGATDGKSPIVIGLNPPLLKNLLDVTGDTEMVMFRVHGHNNAIEFNAGKITGIIMPMVTHGKWEEQIDDDG